MYLHEKGFSSVFWSEQGLVYTTGNYMPVVLQKFFV